MFRIILQERLIYAHCVVIIPLLFSGLSQQQNYRHIIRISFLAACLFQIILCISIVSEIIGDLPFFKIIHGSAALFHCRLQHRCSLVLITVIRKCLIDHDHPVIVLRCKRNRLCEIRRCTIMISVFQSGQSSEVIGISFISMQIQDRIIHCNGLIICTLF